MHTHPSYSVIEREVDLVHDVAERCSVGGACNSLRCPWTHVTTCSAVLPIANVDSTLIDPEDENDDVRA